jgi:hypothetical protein
MFCGCGKPSLAERAPFYDIHWGRRVPTEKLQAPGHLFDVYKPHHVITFGRLQAGISTLQGGNIAESATEIKGPVVVDEILTRGRKDEVDRLPTRNAGKSSHHSVVLAREVSTLESSAPDRPLTFQRSSTKRTVWSSKSPYEQLLDRVSALAAVRVKPQQLGTKWRKLIEQAGSCSSTEGGGALALRILQEMSRTNGRGKIRANAHHIVAALQVSEIRQCCSQGNNMS